MDHRLIFLVINVFFIKINGAPSPESTNSTDLIIDEAPVKYDGAQLWRVQFDDIEARNAVINLQRKFG